MVRNRLGYVVFFIATSTAAQNLELESTVHVKSLLPEAQLENSDELPQSMGALGDSITAGALARFRRQDINWPWNQWDFLLRMLKMGMNHQFQELEFRSLSWAAGMDSHLRVISHARRLKELQGSKSAFQIYNAAVSGAEVKDVRDEQLPRLEAWSREHLKQEAPDYVSILIGANDICAETANDMTSTNDFYKRYYDTVDELLVKSPRTKVMVLGLPNIEQLRSVARKAKTIGLPFFELTCEQLWQKVHLCPTLTTVSDPNERAKIAERVLDYNRALQDIIAKAQAQHGDRARYTNKTYEYKFNKNDLAVDCFHPNYDGQNRVSKFTFADTWWGSSWKSKHEKSLEKIQLTHLKVDAKKDADELKALAIKANRVR